MAICMETMAQKASIQFDRSTWTDQNNDSGVLKVHERWPMQAVTPNSRNVTAAFFVWQLLSFPCRIRIVLPEAVPHLLFCMILYYV